MAKDKFELEHVVFGLDEIIKTMEVDLKPRGFLDLEHLRSVSVIDGLKLAKKLVLAFVEKNEVQHG